MTALLGKPPIPAAPWSGDGVWHVSAIARLLVPDRTTAPHGRTPRLPVPRSGAGPVRQPAAKTPAG